MILQMSIKIAANDSAALRSFHRKLCFHEKILQKRMMCEVREAESTSGGVSRRVDVVGSSGADFDHITQIYESFVKPQIFLLFIVNVYFISVFCVFLVSYFV